MLYVGVDLIEADNLVKIILIKLGQMQMQMTNMTMKLRWLLQQTDTKRFAIYFLYTH